MVTCSHCGLPAAVGDRFCCYGCELADGLAREASSEAGSARGRVGIAIFLAMNVMTVSMVLYSEDLFDDASASAMPGLRALFRWVAVLLGAGVVALLGIPLGRRAIGDLAAGRVGADLLVALAVAAAFVVSVASLLGGGSGIYVEAACMTLVLVTIGRAIEAHAKRRAATALAGALRLGPSEIDVTRGGVRERVVVSAIVPGDLVHVPAGAGIPVDGTIVDGRALVSAAVVSGESRPTARGPGDVVLAGMVAESGMLVVGASSDARSSTLGRLEALVAKARERRARIERIADRVAAAAIPGALAIAVGAGACWWMAEGPVRGVEVALAVLLVACPCSLGIATPLTLWTALGRAASAGAVVRGCDVLESLARVRVAVFDKTGTLTRGAPSVQSVAAVDPAARDRASHLAASLEREVVHPIASAVAQWHHGQGERRVVAEASDVRHELGRGVSGRVDGHDVRVGSRAFLEDGGVDVPSLTPMPSVHVAEDGRWLAGLVLAEAHREDAPSVIGALRDAGIAVELASGDARARVEALGRALDVPAAGGLLPEQKLARIEALERGGAPVLMVGDGVNDGAALARASVGVAVGGSADLASAVAAVTLLGDDLSRIPWLVHLARRASSIVRQNLAWSFAYNVVCVGLAAAGMLAPVWAAVAMLASSLFTLVSSLRLLRERGPSLPPVGGVPEEPQASAGVLVAEAS
ncbi:MAG: cation-translocating P-type ATPase [Deltaproteobacteria bacterium]|nr:cation-translocating P-type ATPase [Deltaproteobacteria bacterium]